MPLYWGLAQLTLGGAKGLSQTQLKSLLKLIGESIENIRKYCRELSMLKNEAISAALPPYFFHFDFMQCVRKDYEIRDDFIKSVENSVHNGTSLGHKLYYFDPNLDLGARALEDNYFVTTHIYEGIPRSSLDSETKFVFTAGGTFNASVYYTFDEKDTKYGQKFHGCDASIPMMRQTVTQL